MDNLKITTYIQHTTNKHLCAPNPHLLWVNTTTQTLIHLDATQKEQARYNISTSKKGLGGQKNTQQTPTGWHRIIERYGQNQPPNVRFQSRRLTGTLADPNSNTDQITSRILRLTGLQHHINKNNNCDSYQRYIYIHGTNHETTLGKPTSAGCIRMSNTDICQLYNNIHTHDTLVYINA